MTVALFQRPPQTPEEVARCAPLSIPPDKVLELDEEAWYAQVYRGEDVPQLTVRAVLIGSILGILLAATNLYVGLMTGWGLGVAITACILSYVLSNAMVATGLQKTQLTILETNCMQSTASSAGYATGSTMISAVAALLMLSATPENPKGAHVPMAVMLGWVFFAGVLGTALAIPMKRNLINRERLKFPSGIASAVTLQSLYSAGGEAMQKAKALLGAGTAGMLFPLLLELNAKVVRNEAGEVVGREPLLPGSSPVLDFLPAHGSHVVDGKTVPYQPSDWTVALDHNPVMIAAGALVGLRMTTWMMIGASLLVWVVGPYGWDQEWTSPVTQQVVRATTAPHKAWKEIGLWLGVPILVSSGLLSFAFQWRTIVRSFQSLTGGAAPSGADAMAARVEVPSSWFVAGVAVGGIGITAIASGYFGIPWYFSLLAVGMTFFLSLVAARATGESDITPTGAMGKLMQLTFGVLIPQSTTANLMTASITSNAAVACADLLNDLKSGYLLGADPRRQYIAQLAGVFSGTIATVVGFYVLVPDATALNGVGDAQPRFPAPAAQAWKAVAEVFRGGIEGMHPVHQDAIVVGLSIGAVVVVLETFAPAAIRRWLPSATGLGLGLILPFNYPLSMFVGALIAWAWQRGSAKTADTFLVPVAAGLIAGISLIGVVVAALNNLLFQ